MIRESLAPDSAYAFMGTADEKLRRQRRMSTGAAVIMNTWANAKFPNLWVRITRSGDLVNRYQSSDGVNWGFTDSRTLPMASEIYIGLVVATDGVTNSTTATFNNVSVVP
jgi:regulation of enolase protein 1 (concanavalin A-like superfamily)